MRRRLGLGSVMAAESIVEVIGQVTSERHKGTWAARLDILNAPRTNKTSSDWGGVGELW